MLVEDHASFRQALGFMLEQEPGFEVVGRAGALAEARNLLAAPDSGPVDVAVLDLGLPDGSGTELMEELRRVNPQVMVLVLTASVDSLQFARAVEAGAGGVMNKTAGIEEISTAVHRLSRGEMLLSVNEVVEMLNLARTERRQDREAESAIEKLTPREREVLQALARGLSSKEIASHLYISEDTERKHVVNILNKLGVRSRLQALVFAVRRGLVDI